MGFAESSSIDNNSTWPSKLLLIISSRISIKKILKKCKDLINKDEFNNEVAKSLDNLFLNNFNKTGVKKIISLSENLVNDNNLPKNTKEYAKQLKENTQNLMKVYLEVDFDTFDKVRDSLKNLYKVLNENLMSDIHCIKNILDTSKGILKNNKNKKDAEPAIAINEKIINLFTNISNKIIKEKKDLRNFYKNNGELDKKILFDKEYWRNRRELLFSEKFGYNSLINIQGAIRRLVYLHKLLSPSDKENNLYVILSNYRGKKIKLRKLKKDIKELYSNSIQEFNENDLYKIIQELINNIDAIKSIHNTNFKPINSEELKFFENNENYKNDKSKKDLIDKLKKYEYDTSIITKLKELKTVLEKVYFNGKINRKNIENASYFQELSKLINYNFPNKYPNVEKGSILYYLDTLNSEIKFIEKMITPLISDLTKEKKYDSLIEIIKEILTNIKKITDSKNKIKELNPSIVNVTVDFSELDKEEQLLMLVEDIKTSIEENIKYNTFTLTGNDYTILKEIYDFYNEHITLFENLKKEKTIDFNKEPLLAIERKILKDQKAKITDEEKTKIKQKLKELRDLIQNIITFNKLFFDGFDVKKLDVIGPSSCLLSAYNNDMVILNKIKDNLPQFMEVKEVKSFENSINIVIKKIEEVGWEEIKKNKDRIEQYKTNDLFEDDFQKKFEENKAFNYLTTREKEDDNPITAYKNLFTVLGKNPAYLKFIFSLIEKFGKIDELILDSTKKVPKLFETISNNINKKTEQN